MQQRFLLQNLLLAQHVSGTTMPIIRSSRVLHSGCCLWYFVLWFSSCMSGVELRVMCPVCRMLQHLLHLVGILFPHINEDAQSKPHQICMLYFSLGQIVFQRMPPLPWAPRFGIVIDVNDRRSLIWVMNIFPDCEMPVSITAV